MNIYLLEQKLKNFIRKEIDKESSKNILEKLKVFLINDENLGDYSTNLIFLLKQFAPEKEQILIEKIKKNFANDFSKIEIVNNYLNFWLSDYQLLKTFRTITKNKNKLFQYNFGRNQKINIDYVSANPTGPLTLGNARGSVLGDTLAQVLKIFDYRVTKEYYVNNRGTQIEILGKTILAHLGYINWEENFYQGEYLKEIAKKFENKIKLANLKEKHESTQININKIAEKIGRKVAEYILNNLIKPALKKFGTTFDWFFLETEIYKNKLDKKVLQILKRKKLIAEKDGALFLLLTKIGENKDEVLIKQNGEPTYFFSDILHYYYKFFIKRNKIEILIVASDHLDHTRRLKSALKIFGIKNNQFLPIVYQFVHLKKGEEFLRMSKRKGVFITLNDLMNEIHPDIARFFFLQKSPETVIEFDLTLAKEKSEKNPYWYIQYAYARLNSVLQKANKVRHAKSLPISRFDPQAVFLNIKDIDSAKIILRKIHQFQDLIYLIYKEKRVHLLAEYLIDFAQKIHSFYEKEKILPDKNKIAFVYSIKEFLSFVLRFINIKPVEKI
jgi:arginyl-tRNA synthetase